MIQSHLKKLFAGIHSVQFNPDETEIVAMKSLEGEVVPLASHVTISTNVEVRVFVYVHVSVCAVSKTQSVMSTLLITYTGLVGQAL